MCITWWKKKKQVDLGTVSILSPSPVIQNKCSNGRIHIRIGGFTYAFRLTSKYQEIYSKCTISHPKILARCYWVSPSWKCRAIGADVHIFYVNLIHSHTKSVRYSHATLDQLQICDVVCMLLFFSLSLPFFSQNEWSLKWKFLRWHLKRVWVAVVYHWNSVQLHLICYFYESNGTNWRHDCQMHICLQWNWYMHASIE